MKGRFLNPSKEDKKRLDILMSYNRKLRQRIMNYLPVTYGSYSEYVEYKKVQLIKRALSRLAEQIQALIDKGPFIVREMK